MSVNGPREIPLHAIERLKGLRGQGHPGGIFTSDFSVNEFLLVRKAGFEPVGLCVGTCVYHVGIQYGSWSKNQELEVLSQAMYAARELAMTRMREEAKEMGADGIVGVRLTIKTLPWDSDILEFMAIGTGIVHAKGQQGFKGVKGEPFTSDLSGQDFWTLLKAGYRPLEMVMGSCVYHVGRQGFFKSLGQVGRNVEMTNFSQALYDAREIAMERMQHEATEAKAEGVVGMVLHEGSHISPQVAKLVEYERKLAARIEQFRTQKDVMRSTYTAAKAQVKVTEALTGTGNRLGSTAGAMRRAEEKVHGMRDRADAMENMMNAGVLTDASDPRSSTQRQIADMHASNAVEDELARLKASSPKVIEGPKD